MSKAKPGCLGSCVHLAAPQRPGDQQGRETSDLISCDGWPDAWGSLKQGAGNKIKKDSRPLQSHFVQERMGSDAQQFVLVREFRFFHSCQIKLIFSHLDLGRFSKLGEKLVYPRSHLSSASAMGTEFFSGFRKQITNSKRFW